MATLLDNQTRLSAGAFFPQLGGGGGGGGGGTNPIVSTTTVSTIVGGGGSGDLSVEANKLFLNTVSGVFIGDATGLGAGTLNVSSINVSSINGASPGGGGSGGVQSIPLSTVTNLGNNQVANLGAFSTVANGLYSISIPIDTITFSGAPAAADVFEFATGYNTRGFYSNAASLQQGNLTYNALVGNVTGVNIACSMQTTTVSTVVTLNNSRKAQIAFLGLGGQP